MCTHLLTGSKIRRLRILRIRNQGNNHEHDARIREFAIKGNVIDLAVGVIIGGAFGKIVDSVVSDLIMPVVGLVFGKLDFSNLFVVLGRCRRRHGASRWMR
jgi:hypothetical protein